MSNLYGKSCTPNLGGVKNFYTKEEIINLLKLKADKYTTYTKEQIDEFIDSIVTGTGFATAEQGELADTAIQPEDLGTAAYTDSSDYATATQGALADTALQPSDLVIERESFLGTTSVIADQASVYLDIEAFSSYALIEILTSHPCRVRIYSDSSSRSADLARPILSGPIAYDSGLIAEIVSETNNYRQIFTPTITGSNLESPFSKTVYLTVTNLSGSSREISITLTLLRLERNPVT